MKNTLFGLLDLGVLEYDSNNIDTDTRKPKDFTTKNDLLALSVYLYRNNKENNSGRFIEFQDADTQIQLSEDDIRMANEVADHFGKQIMMTALAERPLSRFQESVNAFLNSDRRSFTSETKGLIYRLPEFYEYDIGLANIISEHYSNFDHILVDRRLGTDMTLKPIKSLRKNLKSTDAIHYWFIEVDNNTPVMLQLRHDNQIRHIWDHMFATKPTIEISGRFHGVRHPSGLQYATSQKWKMENL